nr:MAG TPA: hypothetical protein [Caudoviricetes sp.]
MLKHHRYLSVMFVSTTHLYCDMSVIKAFIKLFSRYLS